MQKVHIKLNKAEDRSYDILIEEGLMERIPTLLGNNDPGRKYAIISDETVAGLYGKKLVRELGAAGVPAHLLTFKPGDGSKTLAVLERLLNEMSELGFGRGDAVIALGGGVTGDIAGFAASVYMRGVPFFQVPTSLLAMVDSSVGGKTGVNLRSGKNLVGSFHQPKAVYIDPLVLRTLPQTEYLNGLGEVIKYGIIYDNSFFKYVEKNSDKILKHSPGELLHIISRAVEIKSEIVEKDEKESGLRIILNYGHTLGHALESLSGYKILHGQAIASGMILVNKMAVEQRLLATLDADRINNLITGLGLVNKQADKYLTTKNANKIWTLIKHDKKSKNGIVNFVVPVKIGKTVIYSSFTPHHLKGNL